MTSNMYINGTPQLSQHFGLQTPQPGIGVSVHQAIAGPSGQKCPSINLPECSTPPRMVRSNSLPRMGTPGTSHIPQLHGNTGLPVQPQGSVLPTVGQAQPPQVQHTQLQTDRKSVV